MVQFSSVDHHLQIKIAEQIGYSDQLQFLTSSRHSGNVFKLTKHKPVLEIDDLTIFFAGVTLSYKSNSHSDFEKKWSELSQLPVLPRFKVSRVVMRWNAMDTLEELSEKAVFVPSEVIFECRYGSADAFLKISEMFYIKGVCSDYSRDLFSLSAFREIQSVNLHVQQVPDDLLLLLQATKIRLVHETTQQSLITANRFIQQWFEKKRNLECFQVRCYDWNRTTDSTRENNGFKWFQVRCYDWNRTTDSTRENILFSDVPFTFIRNSKYEVIGCPKNIKLRKAISYFNFEECKGSWQLDGSVYSVDRGDKKLMIYYCSGDLIAQEYTNLDDIIEIC